MDTHWIGLILVLIAVSLDAGVQLTLKKTSGAGTHANQWLALGVVFFALNAVAWTFVLRMLDVNVAYPLASLSFVMVAILSKFILKEKVVGKRWAGIGFILCGTALVGLSGN